MMMSLIKKEGRGYTTVSVEAGAVESWTAMGDWVPLSGWHQPVKGQIKMTHKHQ
jgi:hypothetical protein